MKDYDHVILWLDYFNKNISKRKGRRIAKNEAIYDPTMEELEKACRRSGLKFVGNDVNSGGRYPRRPYVRSGYIMLPKIGKKTTMVDRVARALKETRNSNRT